MSKKIVYTLVLISFITVITFAFYGLAFYFDNEANLGKCFLTSIGITIGVIIINYKNFKKAF